MKNQKLWDYLYTYLMLHNGVRFDFISWDDVDESTLCRQLGYIDGNTKYVTKLGMEYLKEGLTL